MLGRYQRRFLKKEESKSPLFISGNSGERKSLKSQRIGKITRQEARRHQVNKVKRILLKIHARIYLLESPYKSFIMTAMKITQPHVLPH